MFGIPGPWLLFLYNPHSIDTYDIHTPAVKCYRKPRSALENSQINQK